MAVDGNDLRVTGTDLDLTIRVETEVIGLDNGICVVPARLAADIVRSLEPGAVTIEDSDGEVEISAARSRFVVRTLPVEDFPVIGEPTDSRVELDTDKFAEALRQVVRAASTDDARPLLTGVLITRFGDGIRLVATDSYRLALRDMTGAEAVPDGVDELLVPARGLGELQRLIGSSSKEDRPLGLSLADTDATFRVGNTRLTTRLLSGKFPDYQQLIPPGYPSKLLVGRDAILEALRRARLLVRDNTTPVRLSMRPGTLEISVSSQEVGHESEEIDAELDGEETTVAFNPAYLADGIEAVQGDDVLIETTDSSKPSTVRAPAQEDYRYLLMPVRVS